MDFVFAVLKSSVSYGFYFSVKTGQFIVTTLSSATTSLWFAISKLLTVLGVILEDFALFLQDVLQRIETIAAVIAYFKDWLSLGVTTILDNIFNFYQLICTVAQGFFAGLLSITNGVKNTFIFVKQVIILLGDGVWFIIVFIPKSLLSLGPLTYRYLHHLCLQIYQKTASNVKLVFKLVFDVYHFITDIPVESFVGLMIALCFVYIFMQFYTIFFMYLRQKVVSLAFSFRRKYNQLKAAVNRLSSRNVRAVRIVEVAKPQPTTSSKNPDNEDDDRLCIICQDHVKCIVILPCKHLCLCSDCNGRLMRYNGRCPICRKPIHRTMKIFI